MQNICEKQGPWFSGGGLCYSFLIGFLWERMVTSNLPEEVRAGNMHKVIQYTR